MDLIFKDTLTRSESAELRARGYSFDTDQHYTRRCSICHVPVHLGRDARGISEWQAEPNRVNHYTNVCPRGDTPTGWGSHYVNTDF